MDPQDKKVALRAITYGLYVMTSSDGENVGAGGVNWLTQASFEPPLVAAGVKADSGLCAVIGTTGTFAVNVLADDQLDIAKAFFRSTTVEGDLVNGHRFERGAISGAPILNEVPYWFECRVTDTIDRGDHTVFVAEVVNAGVRDAARVPLNLRSTGMNYGG
ncbi:MAG: flavin reductase family protein [Microthrixaceae bacterium]|jgi:flavin reductase (DIM6/NTAB) family NADH-FMN oxidoreductase RutF|nr:flavin reductase family protein [Microthrixaceae bacterium]HMT25267.1 flavin reductase family protein [Microthrixaceae bacterium]HMT60051.1 flavin reductase family protein [Microthrixaceae bacterium]